jgi:hypothetical protein
MSVAGFIVPVVVSIVVMKLVWQLTKRSAISATVDS